MKIEGRSHHSNGRSWDLLETVKARLSKDSNGKKALLFACLVLTGTATAWFIYCLTHGSAFASYFVPAPENTGMDYFGMLSLIYDQDLYHNRVPNYPAMCFLVWRVLYHFMPGIPQGGDRFYLRDYMFAQLPYILYTVICLLTICLCARHLLRSLKGENASVTIAALMVSGPIIFTIERGNIILLSLASLMLFVCFYDSPKRGVRYLSYLCLAFSAAIKIYPAIFALLVLRKGRLKEFIHVFIIGIVVFMLPFFAFGGIDAFLTMIRGLFGYTATSEAGGLGYNFSFSILVKIVAALLGVNLQSVPLPFTLLAFAICLALCFLCKETWKKMFLLALMCVWTPSFSYTYVLIFFIPAVVFFLIDSSRGKRDYIYLGLFALLFIPYALPEVAAVSAVLGDVFLKLSWGCMIIHFVLVTFVALFVVDIAASRHAAALPNDSDDGLRAEHSEREMVNGKVPLTGGL